MELDKLKSHLDEKWWAVLIDISKSFQDSRNDCGHAFEVVNTAARIIDREHSKLNISKEIVLVAALLHDIGWSLVKIEQRKKLFSSKLTEAEETVLRMEHEKCGTSLAKDLMCRAGILKPFRMKVCELIDGHDTREKALSDADGILRDADRLWMLSSRGFQADVCRRNIPAVRWFKLLQKRFEKEDFIYTKTGHLEVKKRFKNIEKEYSMKSIIIAHYRVGWTDGVSLEIDKRKSVLEESGYRIILLAGPASRGADYIIDELDFERNEVKAITKESFKAGFSEKTIEAINDISSVIEEKLLLIIKNEKPVFMLTHNIFSHGRHIAAAKAFASVLQKTKIPSLTTHHDFFWERTDFKNPSCKQIEEYLEKYVPPQMKGLKHAVINTLSAESLKNKRNIAAMVFPDTLDFAQNSWEKDEYNSSFLRDFNLHENDVLVLQATRIVRRKGIELIPPILKILSDKKYFSQLKGKRLYNGKMITKKSRIVFILAGYAEHEAEDYKKQIEDYMKELNIEYRFLYPFIASERKEKQNKKIYSLFDTYPYADFISYPSLFEGWGNQFLEAVFSKKPVLLYEYPVFKADIKKIGYKYVSLGSNAKLTDNGLFALSNETIERCANDIVEWLLSKKTLHFLEENYNLAKENNSYKVLRKLMKQGMTHCEDI